MVFDSLYFIMIAPAFLLSLYASFKVKSSFKKYSQVRTRSGMTGADVARRILQQNGLSDVTVTETSGMLSDHYDPRARVVRLSKDVYEGATVAAIGVAAHECGHAIQHKELYAPLKLRNMMVPVASIGSNFSWIVLMGGFVLGMAGLVKVGIALFSIVVLFQLITLPVEFNASSRAKRILAGWGTLQDEQEGVSKMLSSAAMTYVAAATSSVLTLLYYLMRAGFFGSSNDN